LQERFVFPYIPFLAVLAVIALDQYVKSAFKYLLAMALLFRTIGAFEFVRSPAEPFPELKPAGEVLRPYVNAKSLIIDKKPYTTFYAGLSPSQFYETPNVSIEGLHSLARNVKATHLVLAYRPTAIFRPQLMALRTLAGQQQYIALYGALFVIYPGTEYEVWVFEIL